MFSKIVKIGLFMLVCMLSFYAWVQYDAKAKRTNQLNQVPQRFVAIVFGAGIKNGQPSAYLRDRLDAGIQLYKEGKVQRLLLSGDNGRVEYDELEVMKNYCKDHAVDTNHIFVDYAGFDTYSTLVRAQKVFQVNNAVLVSQRYHLNRALYIAKQLGMHAVGFEADKQTYAWHIKNVIREVLATSKAGLEVAVDREPKYLGPEIDIQGKSNFSMK
jgi:SanA protein